MRVGDDDHGFSQFQQFLTVTIILDLVAVIVIGGDNDVCFIQTMLDAFVILRS